MTPLFRRILVPHDFSPQATRALAVAAELAHAHRGSLLVLHVLPSLYPVAGVPMGAPAEMVPLQVWEPGVMDRVRRRLAAVVARALAKRRKVRVECRVVIGDPYQAIVRAARGASAVVMGTLGRTGLPHLLLGSVAEKTVRHSPVPVLTIRPRVVAGRTTRPRPKGARRRKRGS